MSTDRRERIRDLLIEELTEHGDIEEGDIVTHWVALAAVHTYTADEDTGPRDDGDVPAVVSDPAPPIHVQLGMLEHRRITAQAAMTHALTPGWEDE